jgi:hypothetical protein
VKFLAINKFQIFKITHLIIWVIWAVLTVLTNNGLQTKECYTKLFGKYISYTVFNWFELIFMFGGGLLLLFLFVQALKLKYWGFIIFEIIFMIIILVHLKMYFYCG